MALDKHNKARQAEGMGVAGRLAVDVAAVPHGGGLQPRVRLECTRAAGRCPRQPRRGPVLPRGCSTDQLLWIGKEADYLHFFLLVERLQGLRGIRSAHRYPGKLSDWIDHGFCWQCTVGKIQCQDLRG